MQIPKTWHHNSIQDLLVSYGFLIDQDHSWFLKQTVGEEQVIIPFYELAGHTVNSFLGKAEHRGWPLATQAAAPSEQLVPFI